MATLEEPDKGHAWTIAFCACIINGILSGMARMIGLLYVALIDEYKVSREQASLPFTVRNAVRYLAGPLAGILGQTFGVRMVTFFGGVICAAGSALCAFAPTVEMIVFFWGVIHGLGFALANTLFQVVINQYFERHRASASGLVLSGACISSLVLPLVIETLVDKYGVSGCFLLLAGLFLHVLPPSLVLKSPPWIEFPDAYARQRALHYNVPYNNKMKKRRNPESSSSNSTEFSKFGKTSKSNNSHAVLTKYHSMDVLGMTCYEKNGGCQNGINNPAFIGDKDANTDSLRFTPSPQLQNHQPQHSCEEKNENQRSLWRSAKAIPQLYLNPVYDLISMSMATYFLLFIPVVATIIDYPRDKGVPLGQEKFLIHSLTIGDLFGRLGFGWITDRRYISLPTFMLLSFVFQGAFIALFPLANSLAVWIVVVGLYGVTAGIIFAHFPILVHRYVDQENQSVGIGCVGLFSSVCTFGIPPLIGYFRDYVGSYDGLFFIIAACSAINGAFWSLVPLYEKFKETQEKQVINIA